MPAIDLDHDGRLDIVALISQEYEQIDVLLNQGDSRFRSRTLHAAPDLAFGSSGIELVDLDRDGDTDILYTNGDSFDNLYVTPFHGVQWLENRGDLQFEPHRITDLLGAYRALPGDIDLDGDLDIIVVAWVPEQALPVEVLARPLPSILSLEQTSPGHFARHTLEQGSPHHATLELADFDGDGDLDFAVGPHVSFAKNVSRSISIWWNTASRQ